MKKLMYLTVMILIAGCSSNAELESYKSELSECQAALDECTSRPTKVASVTVDLEDEGTELKLASGSLTVHYMENGKPVSATFDLVNPNMIRFKKDFSGNAEKVEISSIQISNTDESKNIQIDPLANRPWIAGVVNYLKYKTNPVAGLSPGLRFVGIEDVRGFVEPDGKINPKGHFVNFLDCASGVNFTFDGTDTYTAKWKSADVPNGGTVYNGYAHATPYFLPPNAEKDAQNYYYNSVFY